MLSITANKSPQISQSPQIPQSPQISQSPQITLSLQTPQSPQIPQTPQINLLQTPSAAELYRLHCMKLYSTYLFV